MERERVLLLLVRQGTRSVFAGALMEASWCSAYFDRRFQRFDGLFSSFLSICDAQCGSAVGISICRQASGGGWRWRWLRSSGECAEYVLLVQA